MATSTEPKTKALVVATRCTSVDQFVATFHRFCDETSFFVSTLAERPVGLETAFSIQLEDKTPVLRGLCTVVEAWSTPVNRFGRPGVRLAVKRLTNESLVVFKMLQTARLAAEAAADANPIAVARTATGPAGRTPVVVAASPPIAAPPPSPAPPPTPKSPLGPGLPRSTVTPPAGLPVAGKPGSPTPPLTSSTRTPPGGVPRTPPGSTQPITAATHTQSALTPTTGTPLARMPLATPPPLPRIDPKLNDASAVPRVDPRVSEAPSLPRYDDTGPVVAPPLSVPPTPPIAIGRAPSASAIAPNELPASPILPTTPPAAPAQHEPRPPTSPFYGRATQTPATATPTITPPVPSVAPKTPATAFARPVPTPTPSIIIEQDLAIPVEPAPRTESGPTKVEGTPISERKGTPAPFSAIAPAPSTDSARTFEPARPGALARPEIARPESVPPDAPARTFEPARPGALARPTPPAGTPPLAAKGEGPLIVAEKVRTVGPRAFAPANLSPITEVEQQPYVPEPIAASDDQTNPVAVESRTPGSSFILPANPLMNLTDQSLEGFVDCALYEETGNFFRAPGYEDSLVDIDDVSAPPPMTLAPVHAIRQGPPTAPPHLSPYAFQPQPEQQFSPEQTPLPMLAPQFPQQQRAYSEPLIPVNSGQHFSMQEAMQHEQHYGAPQRRTPMPRPTPMPGGQIDTSAPIDSTASLLALSAPDPRRRWMVIGGAAVFTSLVLLVIVLAARGGGDTEKADGVKVASTETTPDETTGTTTAVAKPDVAKPDVAKPDVVKPDVVKPAIATTPEIAKPTPPDMSRPTPPLDVPVIDPETAAAIDGPDTLPVVGSGPCKLTVSTTPAGSIVKIDDQIIGPSPIMFAGACKRTKVDVKHPRYALGTKWVNLAAGKPAEIQVPLARPTHAVTIVTVPPGATISIGGNRAGTSPTSVKIMGFTGVTITVEKKGFKPMSQKVYSKVDNDRVMLKLVRGK